MKPVVKRVPVSKPIAQQPKVIIVSILDWADAVSDSMLSISEEPDS